MDFSGCGPVHLLGGICSFIGAVFLGPRLGRFESTKSDSEKEEIVGHSVPVRTLKNTSTWVEIGYILYFQQKMQYIYYNQFPNYLNEVCKYPSEKKLTSTVIILS
jgi:ammonia channel protein AmtB